MQNKSDLIIYTTEDGLTKIDVTFDDNTVWLSQADMAELFQKAKSTINEHIKNIIKNIPKNKFIFLFKKELKYREKNKLYVGELE